MAPGDRKLILMSSSSLSSQILIWGEKNLSGNSHPHSPCHIGFLLAGKRKYTDLLKPQKWSLRRPSEQGPGHQGPWAWAHVDVSVDVHHAL